MERTNPTETRRSIVLIGLLFFVFGFVTWLNGTLISFLKLVCQLNNDIEAFFVTSAFYMAYFFLAIPSAQVLKRTGYKKGMALGLFVLAIGCLFFVPAAHTRNFPLFLFGLFVQGMGLAMVQTASNPYISILGPIESAAQRISVMGICNKVAGALGPVIMGVIVLNNATALEKKISQATSIPAKNLLLNDLSGRIVGPYIVMAAILVLVALLTIRSSLPEIDTDAEEVKNVPDNNTSIFQFPHLLLGALCIFLYVGVEVMAGDAIGLFGRSNGMNLDTTKYFTTFTLIAMLVGYVIGIFTIPKYITQQAALSISAITGIIFSVCVYFSSGYVAITFIALLGLSNALMWPAIFPLAIRGIGKFTKMGSAFLVMGISGAAIIPLLYGILKDKLHLPNSLSFMLCTLPCYVYIFYYSVSGYKAGKKVSVMPRRIEKVY